MRVVRLIMILMSGCLWTVDSFSVQREERDVIEETLNFSDPRGPKELVVDNINGSIEVIGYGGNDVELVVRKTIFASSKDKLAEASRKVRLDISEEDNSIVLFVDAPYRQRDGSINYRGWRYYGYKVEFDFQIKVPRDTDVFLRTINNGEITVEGVKGDFDIDNVNGGIEIVGASGSGRAYALNGQLTVEFDENPDSDCYFGSLNGKIQVAFQSGFSADLRFKTFNGDVYTDFPITYLNTRKPSRKREKGKFVYKSDRSFGARVGRGGPEIEFDGFNGEIHVVRS